MPFSSRFRSTSTFRSRRIRYWRASRCSARRASSSRPEQVHALRALAAEHSKQTLQVGLQRRYSKYYQAVKDMIDKGMLGDVTHIQAQWHRNPGWVMKAGGKSNPKNWRLFREYSGGLTAELASHQVDVADWYFGAHPDFVMGLGGLDYWHDGRDIYDNIQLIYSYPKGRKLTYSAITTNSHLPMFGSIRPEFGEVIMGTEGAIEMTVGDGQKTMPLALWYREATPTKVAAGNAENGNQGGRDLRLSRSAKRHSHLHAGKRSRLEERFVSEP